MFFAVRSKQDISRALAYIQSIDIFGKRWCIEVKEYKPKRSLAQNRCFHAFVGEIAKHRGYSASEMKVLIKHHFGLHEYVTNKKTGEVIPALRSTADMGIDEMAQLITQVEALAARDGIALDRNQDYAEAMGTDAPSVEGHGRGRGHVNGHMENTATPALHEGRGD